MPSLSLSRRDLLRAAAASVAFAVPAQAARARSLLAYVGTSTPSGQGIHTFRVDSGTGRMTPLAVTPAVNASWLALHPSKRVLYAVSEIGNLKGKGTGGVNAFAVDASDGGLTLLNTVSSGGAGPTHLSVDPSGRHLLVANYAGGSVAVLPISGDGSLGAATDVVADVSACSPACAVGPVRAELGPPGSFANSGHDAPHAHMIQTDPAGRFVIANDLGLDRTLIWQFDSSAGKLLNPRSVPSSRGAGPRHFAFHPNRRWFYSLNEESSTIAVMTYDEATGALAQVQEVSTLPASFGGTSFTSEVTVSDDGRFVHTANRLHNTIAIFSIGPQGRLTRRGEEWTRGDYPRHFAIAPGGRFLYVCNHRSDNVTIFRVEGGGGRFGFSGQYVPVGSPAVIVFLAI